MSFQPNHAETHRVEIPIDDTESLAGILRLPDGDAPHAGLVFLGPLTSVKEQVPGNYAAAMTRHGFATLAIDNRHFGESSGQPRQYEHPPRKVEDVCTALNFLAAHPAIDGSRLGAVGICAGAGYMSGVAASDPRVRAYAAVAGFFHDADRQREWMGDGYAAALKRARQARIDWEETGEAETIPAVGKHGEVAMPLDEAFEYYGTERGAHANYVNAFTIMSREHTLPWNARALAPQIRVPTLMIHSENALAPALARAFFDALGGPKSQVWMESKGQIDFYDDPALIEPIAELLARHFTEHML